MEEKKLPTIPLLVPLLTYPLRTFAPSHPELFLDAYTLLIHHVLSLPLLPNRLPLASLTHLSANLPLAAASVLSPSIPQMATALGVEAKVHLLANLAAFVPPRYPSLPAASLTTLLHLMAKVMSTLPIGALEPTSSVSNGKQAAISESDSDSDSEDLTRASASASTPVPLPRLDERTLKRLQTLPATTHISSLIRATQSHTSARIALCDFFFALCTVWPSRADPVLSTVVVSTGGGLVRELYRGYVRSSPVGGDDNLITLLGAPFYLISDPASRLMTPRRRRPCRYLAPFTFLDRPVHAFSSHHGGRRVFLRSWCTDPCRCSAQPAHIGRGHISISEILEHRLHALLERRADRCPRRPCSQPQHQMGWCAAKTNAFPASGAHAGVRTAAP